MISESAQEQATLYALGLLDAGEAGAFERELGVDAELRALTDELRETAANLARTAVGEPPVALKARVMELVAAEGPDLTPRRVVAAEPAAGKVVAGPWKSWLPWAIAAALMLCCGALAWDREQWQQKYAALDREATDLRVATAQLKLATPPPADALRQVVFCPLEPTPQTAPPQPRAAVLWDGVRREGKLRLQHLPPPGAGHDYQLWVVEAGHKETVSAGVVTLADQPTMEVNFQPVPQGGTDRVVAFAISLERAGGSPTNQGPVLFLGKL